MKKHEDFSNFIIKLEEKILNNEQEIMILNAISGNEIGGSNGTCENTASSCDGTTNRICTNQNSTGCNNTTNRRQCTKSISPI